MTSSKPQTPPGKVGGINISSISEDELGRALTNPTRRYGKFGEPGETLYPLLLNRKDMQRLGLSARPAGAHAEFTDVEAWYKANKSTDPDAATRMRKDRQLMIRLITEKLNRYPKLVQAIKERGGIDFLASSSHITNAEGRIRKGDRWAGRGLDSQFIRALQVSYSNVTGDFIAEDSDIASQIRQKEAAKPKVHVRTGDPMPSRFQRILDATEDELRVLGEQMTLEEKGLLFEQVSQFDFDETDPRFKELETRMHGIYKERGLKSKHALWALRGGLSPSIPVYTSQTLLTPLSPAVSKISTFTLGHKAKEGSWKVLEAEVRRIPETGIDPDIERHSKLLLKMKKPMTADELLEVRRMMYGREIKSEALESMKRIEGVLGDQFERLSDIGHPVRRVSGFFGYASVEAYRSLGLVELINDEPTKKALRVSARRLSFLEPLPGEEALDSLLREVMQDTTVSLKKSFASLRDMDSRTSDMRKARAKVKEHLLSSSGYLEGLHQSLPEFHSWTDVFRERRKKVPTNVIDFLASGWRIQRKLEIVEDLLSIQRDVSSLHDNINSPSNEKVMRFLSESLTEDSFLTRTVNILDAALTELSEKEKLAYYNAFNDRDFMIDGAQRKVVDIIDETKEFYRNRVNLLHQLYEVEEEMRRAGVDPVEVARRSPRLQNRFGIPDPELRKLEGSLIDAADAKEIAGALATMDEVEDALKERINQQSAEFATRAHLIRQSRSDPFFVADAGSDLESRTSTIDTVMGRDAYPPVIPHRGTIIHSGGARGIDTLWEEMAGEKAVVVAHSFDEHTVNNESLQKVWSPEELEKNDPFIRRAGAKWIKRSFSHQSAEEGSEYIPNLIRRNFYQVRDSEAVVALGMMEGGMPKGGTAWAVAFGLEMDKPVHFYDLREQRWLTWRDSVKEFVPSDPPPVYRSFAGVGTRDTYDEPNLEHNARQAMRAYIDQIPDQEYQANPNTRSLKPGNIEQLEDAMKSNELFPSRFLDHPDYAARIGLMGPSGAPSSGKPPLTKANWERYLSELRHRAQPYQTLVVTSDPWSVVGASILYDEGRILGVEVHTPHDIGIDSFKPQNRGKLQKVSADNLTHEYRIFQQTTGIDPFASLHRLAASAASPDSDQNPATITRSLKVGGTRLDHAKEVFGKFGTEGQWYFDDGIEEGPTTRVTDVRNLPDASPPPPVSDSMTPKVVARALGIKVLDAKGVKGSLAPVSQDNLLEVMRHEAITSGRSLEKWWGTSVDELPDEMEHRTAVLDATAKSKTFEMGARYVIPRLDRVLLREGANEHVRRRAFNPVDGVDVFVKKGKVSLRANISAVQPSTMTVELARALGFDDDFRPTDLSQAAVRKVIRDFHRDSMTQLELLQEGKSQKKLAPGSADVQAQRTADLSMMVDSLERHLEGSSMFEFTEDLGEAQRRLNTEILNAQRRARLEKVAEHRMPDAIMVPREYLKDPEKLMEYFERRKDSLDLDRVGNRLEWAAESSDRRIRKQEEHLQREGTGLPKNTKQRRLEAIERRKKQAVALDRVIQMTAVINKAKAFEAAAARLILKNSYMPIEMTKLPVINPTRVNTSLSILINSIEALTAKEKDALGDLLRSQKKDFFRLGYDEMLQAIKTVSRGHITAVVFRYGNRTGDELLRSGQGPGWTAVSELNAVQKGIIKTLFDISANEGYDIHAQMYGVRDFKPGSRVGTLLPFPFWTSSPEKVGVLKDWADSFADPKGNRIESLSGYLINSRIFDQFTGAPGSNDFQLSTVFSEEGLSHLFDGNQRALASTLSGEALTMSPRALLGTLMMDSVVQVVDPESAGAFRVMRMIEDEMHAELGDEYESYAERQFKKRNEIKPRGTTSFRYYTPKSLGFINALMDHLRDLGNDTDGISKFVRNFVKQLPASVKQDPSLLDLWYKTSALDLFIDGLQERNILARGIRLHGEKWREVMDRAWLRIDGSVDADLTKRHQALEAATQRLSPSSRHADGSFRNPVWIQEQLTTLRRNLREFERGHGSAGEIQSLMNETRKKIRDLENDLATLQRVGAAELVLEHETRRLKSDPPEIRDRVDPLSMEEVPSARDVELYRLRQEVDEEYLREYGEPVKRVLPLSPQEEQALDALRSDRARLQGLLSELEKSGDVDESRRIRSEMQRKERLIQIAQDPVYRTELVLPEEVEAMRQTHHATIGGGEVTPDQVRLFEREERKAARAAQEETRKPWDTIKSERDKGTRPKARKADLPPGLFNFRGNVILGLLQGAAFTGAGMLLGLYRDRNSNSVETRLPWQN